MKDFVNIIPKPRWWSSLWSCLLVVLTAFPVIAYGHSAERGLVMLLPTGYYVVGGALAVICSFMLLSLVSTSWLRRFSDQQLPLFTLPQISTTPVSMVCFLVLTLLLIAGFAGSTDPLANPLPLVIWTLWWVGFTVLQFLIGNLWNHCNPWSGPAHLLRRFARFRSVAELPAKLGYLIAILQFSAVAWFELVDLAPEDPGRLAMATCVFWLFNFCGVLLFGERDWFARAEPFAIFFRLVGACSPVVRSPLNQHDGTKKKVQYSLTWPGQGLIALPPLPLSGILFVLLTLSVVSFDAYAKTFAWLGIIGINPLEFPGRSVVQGSNTVGLILTFAILASLFLLAVYLGWKLSQRCGWNVADQNWLGASGRLVYSIIPISIAFHMTHYLTVLLVNGQYALIALSDPLGSGRGLAASGFYPTTSFLNDLHSVSVIWVFQTVVVVAGHIIGITVAHLLALEMTQATSANLKAASVSQLFLGLLMVGYTVFGLWLLSTASVG